MDIEEELLGPVENGAHSNDTPATSVYQSFKDRYST